MNPASLMEVPPNEEELEQILEKAESEEPKEVTEEATEVSSEVETEEIKEDSTDYSSMKVAELKELLKERELPVSALNLNLLKDSNLE